MELSALLVKSQGWMLYTYSTLTSLLLFVQAERHASRMLLLYSSLLAWNLQLTLGARSLFLVSTKHGFWAVL